MPSIRISGEDVLQKKMNDLLKQFPEKRRGLHEKLAELGKNVVDESIRATVNDTHGHVQSWQESTVGSGGGYARVKPMKGSRTKGNRTDAYGALTRYIDAGHGNARGREFYAASTKRLETEAVRIAEKFVDEIVKELGG